MKVRIGGPLGVRFEMNPVMLAGVVFGILGVGIWALQHWSLLPGALPWDDVALGVTLLGIALYFVGRIVDLWAYFRRKR
jgi:hypothetical protein